MVTGGNQLTRERFSGAKKLRAGSDVCKDKFGHLSPITFEFFHLLMNLLKAFNHFLYSEKSIQVGVQRGITFLLGSAFSLDNGWYGDGGSFTCKA